MYRLRYGQLLKERRHRKTGFALVGQISGVCCISRVVSTQIMIHRQKNIAAVHYERGIEGWIQETNKRIDAYRVLRRPPGKQRTVAGVSGANLVCEYC